MRDQKKMAQMLLILIFFEFVVDETCLKKTRLWDF